MLPPLASSSSSISYTPACCSCSRLSIDSCTGWQIPRTRAHIVIVGDWLKSAVSRPTFGLPMADTERTHPLGKELHIRIDRERVLPRIFSKYSRSSAVEGCRLPISKDSLAQSESHRSYYVRLYYTSEDPGKYVWRSSFAYEGKGLLQSVVQWNETTYM